VQNVWLYFLKDGHGGGQSLPVRVRGGTVSKTFTRFEERDYPSYVYFHRRIFPFHLDSLDTGERKGSNDFAAIFHLANTFQRIFRSYASCSIAASQQ